MQKISFKLEVFEGPMDLLLSLISKHKLNIYDIEISSLLEQYLAYLDQCREQDLELAGEFLEMAARLIYIKTASLLPRPEEAQKEKQALQGALIEYALCKQAAQVLAQRYVGGKIYTRPPMEIAVSAAYARTHLPYVLLETWNAMGKKRFAPEDQARDRLQRVVTRPVVSVMSKVVYVMRKVYHDEHVYLGALYADIRERSARVALFLAVLELTKHGRIGIRTARISTAGRTTAENTAQKPGQMQNLPSWYESTESGNDNGKKHQITAMPYVGGGSVRQRRAGDALSAGTGVRGTGIHGADGAETAVCLV